MAAKTAPIPPPSYGTGCERSAASQMAMDEWAEKQAHELESELARALAAETSDFGTTLVVVAQHAWMGYEAAECRLEERPYAGGTIQPLIYAECEQGLLVVRIDQIRSDVGAVRR